MGNVADRLEEPITDKETDRGEANGLRYGVSCMQGWRTGMEDSHTLSGSLPGLLDVSFFGVYDGHGGSFTANHIGRHLERIFSNRKEIRAYAELDPIDRDDVPGIRLLKAALNGAFLEIDSDLRKIQRYSSSLERTNNRSSSERDDDLRREDRSGSTCVVVIITPKHIICANAGDSRACFRRDGKALPLSFDHKPSNCAELSRIKNAGGTVTVRRVDGDLAVSRGLGDFQYKNRSDLPPEKQKVSCIPDITLYPRNHMKDEFIVLACDGIWDVVTNDECIEFIQEILDEGEMDLGLVSEEMLDICLDRDSRDNMSIIIIACPGVSYGEGEGISGRRMERAKSMEGSIKSATRSRRKSPPSISEVMKQ